MVASNTIEKVRLVLTNSHLYPGLIARRQFDRELHLWKYPSFENYCDWSLFRDKNKYWVRRIIGDMSKQPPSNDWEPITYGCEAIFPNEQAEELLRTLAKIKFCPFDPLNLIGMDGTIQGIEKGNHWLSCKVQWWSLPSDDWRPLSAWFVEAVQKLDSVLPEKSV